MSDVADGDQLGVAAAFLNFAQDLHDRLGEVVIESKEPRHPLMQRPDADSALVT